MISIAAFVLGIPFGKLSYLFYLVGVNFFSEVTFYNYIKSITPKIKPITEDCLKKERIKYGKNLMKNFKNKIIKKNQPEIVKSLIENLPFEIISLIYSFLFEGIYMFASIDGRYSKRRNASQCSVFFFDLYIRKRILFFSNISKISCKGSNENKYALPSNLLEM